jgi:hypothetical protein
MRADDPNGWAQERFYSQLRVALLTKDLDVRRGGTDVRDVLHVQGFNASIPLLYAAIAIGECLCLIFCAYDGDWVFANNADPSRAETFYELANGFRMQQNYLACCESVCVARKRRNVRCGV